MRSFQFLLVFFERCTARSIGLVGAPAPHPRGAYLVLWPNQLIWAAATTDRTRSAGASKASRCLSEMLPLLDLCMGCALLRLFLLGVRLSFGFWWCISAVLQQRKSESVPVLQLLQWELLCYKIPNVFVTYNFDSDITLFLYASLWSWLLLFWIFSLLRKVLIDYIDSGYFNDYSNYGGMYRVQLVKTIFFYHRTFHILQLAILGGNCRRILIQSESEAI